jgi:hypothetical protein
VVIGIIEIYILHCRHSFCECGGIEIISLYKNGQDQCPTEMILVLGLILALALGQALRTSYDYFEPGSDTMCHKAKILCGGGGGRDPSYPSPIK